MKKILGNKKFHWLLKILFTLAFVYIINRNVLTKLGLLLDRLTWQYLGVAAIFSFGGLFFQVKRWEIILRFQNFPVGGGVPWKTILWGNLLAFITPGRVGELFRGLTIAEGRKADSLFAVVIDKLFIIFTVLWVGLLSIISLKWLLHAHISREVMIFLITAFFVCVTGMVILMTGKVFDKKHVLSTYLSSILENIPRLFNPAGKKAVGFSFAAHTCLMCQTVTLLSMFGCTDIVKSATAVGLAYGVMPFLSFTIGNMGVREGAFSFFLSYLGAQVGIGTLSLQGASLGTSLVILIMNIVLPAFIGLVWYLLDNPRATIIKS